MSIIKINSSGRIANIIQKLGVGILNTFVETKIKTSNLYLDSLDKKIPLIKTFKNALYVNIDYKEVIEGRSYLHDIHYHL